MPGQGIGTGLSGCKVETVDWSDLDVVQFTEKRSLGDGLDVGDVYLGGRRIHMVGSIAATTRASLYDALRTLRAALSPTLAFRQAPGDKGYQPLYFSEPTNDQDNWPDGAIPMRVLALPRNFQATVRRDAQGGDDGDAIAIEWACLFTMRDPRIYAECPVEIDFADASDVAGNINNPGNSYSPLNGEWTVGSAAGSIKASIGDSQFVITVPASTGNRVIRFKGDDKILTFEENSVETLGMDKLAFLNNTNWPLLPPGVSPYSIDFTTITLTDTTSKLWFWPSWA